MATPLQALRGGYGPSARAPVPPELRQLIERIATQEGVDPALLTAVVRQETGGGKTPFDPRAAGGAGDYGIAQITLPVARAYLKNPRLTPDDLYDVPTNLTAAARFLKDLGTKYGDTKQVLTAYNSGETRMNRAVRAANAAGTDWESELTKINKDNVKYGNEAIALYQGAPPAAAPPVRTVTPGPLQPRVAGAVPSPPRDVGPEPEMTTPGRQPVTPPSTTALQEQPSPAPGPTLGGRMGKPPAGPTTILGQPAASTQGVIPPPVTPTPLAQAPPATPATPSPLPSAPGAPPRGPQIVPATPEEIALGLDSPNLPLAPGASAEAPPARFPTPGAAPRAPSRVMPRPPDISVQLTAPGNMNIPATGLPTPPPDVPEDYPIPGPAPLPRTPAEAAAVLPVMPYQVFANPPFGLGGAKPPGIDPPPAPIVGGLRVPPVPMGDVTGGTLPPDAGATVPNLLGQPSVVPRAQIPGAPPLGLGTVPPTITTPDLPPQTTLDAALDQLTNEELLDLYEYLNQQGAGLSALPGAPAPVPGLPSMRPRSFQEESLYWGREGGP